MDGQYNPWLPPNPPYQQQPPPYHSSSNPMNQTFNNPQQQAQNQPKYDTQSPEINNSFGPLQPPPRNDWSNQNQSEPWNYPNEPPPPPTNMEFSRREQSPTHHQHHRPHHPHPHRPPQPYHHHLLYHPPPPPPREHYHQRPEPFVNIPREEVQGEEEEKVGTVVFGTHPTGIVIFGAKPNTIIFDAKPGTVVFGKQPAKVIFGAEGKQEVNHPEPVQPKREEEPERKKRTEPPKQPEPAKPPHPREQRPPVPFGRPHSADHPHPPIIPPNFGGNLHGAANLFGPPIPNSFAQPQFPGLPSPSEPPPSHLWRHQSEVAASNISEVPSNQGKGHLENSNPIPLPSPAVQPEEELVQPEQLPSLGNLVINPPLSVLSQVQRWKLTAVPNVTISNEHGSVTFLEPISLLNTDLSQAIKIKPSLIDVKDEELQAKKRELTFINFKGYQHASVEAKEDIKVEMSMVLTELGMTLVKFDEQSGDLVGLVQPTPK